MPERPKEVSLPNILSEEERRLRDLERQLLRLPESTKPLETFEDGSPLGPTRFLNFGTGIQSILRSEGYVEISAASGLEFDAIVDESLAASDPTNRHFRGIGEALTYLNSIGLTEAGVAVRSGTYNETANWNTPAVVRLFGIRGSARTTISTGGRINSTPVRWTWGPDADGDFRPLDISDLHVDNMFIEPGAMTGHGDVGPFDTLTAYNCNFTWNLPVSPFEFCNNFYGHNCQFDFVGPAGTRVLARNEAIMSNCDVAIRGSSGAALTIILGASNLIAMGGQWFCSSVSSITLPVRFKVDVQKSDGWIGGSSVAGTFTVPATARGSIRCDNSLTDAVAWSVDATAAFTALILNGEFRDVECTGAHESLLIDAYLQAGGDMDIAGPAGINLVTRNNYNIILRGNTIHGGISARDLTGSSGIFLIMAACDDCNIQVAANGSGTTGTYQPFSLDANSDRNILHFAGASTFPAVGPDSGTNNLVTTT